MKTDYFQNCKNIDQAKKKFRELALKFHPDCGGSINDFLDLKKQYDNFKINKASDPKFKEYRYNENRQSANTITLNELLLMVHLAQFIKIVTEGENISEDIDEFFKKDILVDEIKINIDDLIKTLTRTI